jgi:cysteinyl-tRNA synthetase
MHNAMINIDGQKMSKSLGNVRWAKDVIEMLGADVVRWLMLSVHYRGELNFSDETIETAKTELNKVKMALKQAELKIALQSADAVEVLDEGYAKFIDAMNQDMNTPNAYAVIFEEVKKLNTLCRTREVNVEALGSAVYSLRKMLEVLGVMIPVLTLSEEDRALYQAWMDAKAQKDFAKADEVRAQLMERGIL